MTSSSNTRGCCGDRGQQGHRTSNCQKSKFTGDVYLTARDTGRGQEAVALLISEGLNPKFHQLDISSQESIDTLKKFVEEKYVGIDVLINIKCWYYCEKAGEKVFPTIAQKQS